MYIYIRDAFGPFPAFLYAWMAYFVILAGADAAVAVGFAEYFSVFFPALGTKHVLFTAAGFPVSAGQLVAVAAVLILSATHYVGVREGSRIQGVFTLLIVIALALAGGRRRDRPGAGRDDGGRDPSAFGADLRRGLRHARWSPSSGATTAGTRSPRSPARSPTRTAICPSRSSSGPGS